MPRRRFVWDDKLKELVEVSTDYRQSQAAPYVIPDTPDYVSPATGLVVSGRKQRREDLKRSGCRPWEGMDAEKKEAARQRQYSEQRHDQRLEVAARTAYHQLPLSKRRILEGH